jgi:hypothetical protein
MYHVLLLLGRSMDLFSGLFPMILQACLELTPNDLVELRKLLVEFPSLLFRNVVTLIHNPAWLQVLQDPPIDKQRIPGTAGHGRIEAVVCWTRGRQLLIVEVAVESEWMFVFSRREILK